MSVTSRADRAHWFVPNRKDCSMIRFQNSRWFLSVVVAALTLASSSGCKQMSSWKNMSLRPSTSTADPFAYPQNSDTYFHQPEGAPLSPVPDLPAPGPELPSPGPSSPMDPPPPPVPSEGANAPKGPRGSVTSRLKQLMTPRPVSFFNKREVVSETAETSPRNSQPAVSNSTRRPVVAAEEYRPSANIERASSRLANQSLPVDNSQQSYSEPAPKSGPKIIVTPGYGSSFPAKPLADGPVITPGSQYMPNPMGRDVPIEKWPHTQMAEPKRGTVHLRKQPAPVSADAFVPAEQLPPQAQPVLAPPVLAPPAASPSPASVPLLLPPGP